MICERWLIQKACEEVLSDEVGVMDGDEVKVLAGMHDRLFTIL